MSSSPHCRAGCKVDITSPVLVIIVRQIFVSFFLSLVTTLGGEIPRSKGEVLGSKGEVHMSAGEVPMSAEEISTSAGKVPMFAENVSMSAGEVPMSAAKVSMSAEEVTMSVREVPLSVGEVPMYKRGPQQLVGLKKLSLALYEDTECTYWTLFIFTAIVNGTWCYHP